MKLVERRNLHIRLSEEAFQGHVNFANEVGVSLTALFEAGGRLLKDRGEESTIEELIALARTIDREHRSRRD